MLEKKQVGRTGMEILVLKRLMATRYFNRCSNIPTSGKLAGQETGRYKTPFDHNSHLGLKVQGSVKINILGQGPALALRLKAI